MRFGVWVAVYSFRKRGGGGKGGRERVRKE